MPPNLMTGAEALTEDKGLSQVKKGVQNSVGYYINFHNVKTGIK